MEACLRGCLALEVARSLPFHPCPGVEEVWLPAWGALAAWPCLWPVVRRLALAGHWLELWVEFRAWPALEARLVDPCPLGR